MVAHPGDYRWSSHAANADGAPVLRLTPHPEYLALGASAESRRETYRALFAIGVDPRLTRAIRESTDGNVALGNSRFQAEIETMLQRRARRGIPGRPRKRDKEEQAGSTCAIIKNVVCP